MKKLISIFMCLAMLFGIICAFPAASAAYDTPYSGGSGTEDDPYLISTGRDILELRNNIIDDPSLWYTKYYYKLTNDIETYETVSPLYKSSYYEDYGGNSLVKADVTLDNRIPTYLSWEAWNYRNDTLIAAGFQQTDTEGYNPYYFNNDLFFGNYYVVYYRNLYRSAAFTGVFDGNGYTITLKGNDKYLFGFVENGAVIKNLNLVGKDAALAYCVDRSTISSCSFDSDNSTVVVNYNLGTITDFMNYSDNIKEFWKDNNGPTGWGGYGTKNNIVNFSQNASNNVGDDCYTLDECTAAGGDISAFEHLDFENVWVMIDGLPKLRSSCEKGDATFDGTVNGKDANMIKQLISRGTADTLECEIMISDLNSDGAIDAKDANLIKQKLLG